MEPAERSPLRPIIAVLRLTSNSDSLKQKAIPFQINKPHNAQWESNENIYSIHDCIQVLMLNAGAIYV